ncbi:hypothetical protein, partial [Pseudomonas syringae]
LWCLDIVLQFLALKEEKQIFFEKKLVLLTIKIFKVLFFNDKKQMNIFTDFYYCWTSLAARRCLAGTRPQKRIRISL